MLRIATLCLLFDWCPPIYIPDFHETEVYHHEIKAFHNSAYAISNPFFWLYDIFFLVLRTLFPFFSIQPRLATQYTQRSIKAQFLKYRPIFSLHTNYSLSSFNATSIFLTAHATALYGSLSNVKKNIMIYTFPHTICIDACNIGTYWQRNIDIIVHMSRCYRCLYKWYVGMCRSLCFFFLH
jgi:hypothetical protein